MPTSKNYFLRSGIIAISIYIMLIISILYGLNKDNLKRITSFNKSTSVEIDLSILDESDVKKTAFEKPTIKEEIQIAEKSASKATVTKEVDAKSLFSNVSTKAKATTKENVTTQQSVKVASTQKSTFEKEERKQISSNVSKTLENVNLNPTSSLAPPSDADVDEYYSLVYEILASKWQPSTLKKNLSCDVIITIYKNGKFGYNIISYSGDASFDSSLERFLNSQLNEKFPEHTKGDKTTLKVSFKTKGD